MNITVYRTVYKKCCIKIFYSLPESLSSSEISSGSKLSSKKLFTLNNKFIFIFYLPRRRVLACNGTNSSSPSLKSLSILSKFAKKISLNYIAQKKVFVLISQYVIPSRVSSAGELSESFISMSETVRDSSRALAASRGFIIESEKAANKTIARAI